MRYCQIFALLTIIPALVVADEITIVGDVWPPYNTEPGSATPGYAIEIAQQVFAAKGHKVKYEVVPWSRAVDGTQKGTYTAAVGGFEGDVAGALIPKEPVGISDNEFFTKKGSPWIYQGFASLAGKQVGLIQGYTYDKGAFDAWAKSAKNIQWSSGEAPLILNLKKLDAGRVDCILEDVNVVTYTAKENGLAGKFQIAGNANMTNRIYILFSPANSKSPEYTKILSDGIAEMRKNGKLQIILSKYGIKDWK